MDSLKKTKKPPIRIETESNSIFNLRLSVLGSLTWGVSLKILSFYLLKFLLCNYVTSISLAYHDKQWVQQLLIKAFTVTFSLGFIYRNYFLASTYKELVDDTCNDLLIYAIGLVLRNPLSDVNAFDSKLLYFLMIYCFVNKPLTPVLESQILEWTLIPLILIRSISIGTPYVPGHKSLNIYWIVFGVLVLLTQIELYRRSCEVCHSVGLGFFILKYFKLIENTNFNNLIQLLSLIHICLLGYNILNRVKKVNKGQLFSVSEKENFLIRPMIVNTLLLIPFMIVNLTYFHSFYFDLPLSKSRPSIRVFNSNLIWGLSLAISFGFLANYLDYWIPKVVIKPPSKYDKSLRFNFSKTWLIMDGLFKVVQTGNLIQDLLDVFVKAFLSVGVQEIALLISHAVKNFYDYETT